jgi:hypothetical protein
LDHALQNDVSRRAFLAASAAAAVTQAAHAAPVRHTTEPDWWRKPSRWVNFFMVENDPPNLDTRFWFDYFKRIHADAARLTAGGTTAFYPTVIPLHHRSAWLGEGDPFGALVAGCRELKMKIIARVDPHATTGEAAKAHPEWIAADVDGRPRPHESTPGLWITCALGDYNFSFMTGVLREIMSRYDVDAVFANRWNGSGMCYCESCRKQFQAFSGMDLPRGKPTYTLPNVHPKDTPWYVYSRWLNRRLLELWDLWDAELRKINPHSRFIPNMGGGQDLDMEEIARRATILTLDRQGRGGTTPPWAIGRSAKQFRAVCPQATLGASFSVGVEGGFRWKDSVQSGPEIQIWAGDGIANGLRLTFTKFCTTLYDRRWLAVEDEQFNWHYRSEKYLRNQFPLARAAMVDSPQTTRFYKASGDADAHVSGMYQALVEARVPFEMAHERFLDRAHLDRYKLLILPNVAALSDGQCSQLADFVRRGGSLLATYETSLYDEWGVKRKNFGLAELFGVSYRGRQGPMQNSYARIEAGPDGGRHPLVAGFDGAERIVNSVYRLEVEASGAPANPPLTLIPSYPDLPMEQLYPRVARTDIPLAYARQVGAGRVVYLPGDWDSTFWQFLLEDHARLLKNAILWAANEEPPVTVSGPGLLDVTVWRQQDSMTIHLVNLSNPMAMRGYYREFLPVGPLRLRIRLPDSREAGQVRFLVGAETPAVERQPGFLTLTIPSVLSHEVVAVDL